MTDIQVRTDPRTAFDPASEDKLKALAADAAGVEASRIRRMAVRRRSIDARQKRVMVNLGIRLWLDGDNLEEGAALGVELPPLRNVGADAPRVAVVGAGPAGLFAALRLLELGFKPIVLERGKDVDSRRLDTAAIAREGRVDPDSNYCFGEGGAGTFSDGKLYTRSKKRGPVDKVLTVFHRYGADDSVLVDQHPHIGSDRLPSIIKNIRLAIEAHGGEIRFNSRVEGLASDADGAVCGVRLADGNVVEADAVILATGHSASDVYRWLDSTGVDLEAKGIAVGVRLEHPQQLIDRLRYHSAEGRGRWLPPAEYTMLTRVDDRAVYSFCMCPGGVIVPAASDAAHMVVNGMSGSGRSGRFANSGMVVEILPEDIPAKYAEAAGPRLAMLAYRDDIESRFAADAPSGTQNAAAQRMTDFVKGRPSATLPPTSYAPGVHPARVDLLLPGEVASRLRRGFAEFGRKSPGFLTPEALVIGDETRTSSPVRITRDDATLLSTSTPGLFPCGEGAGYAGGIVSAAVDGLRCADAAKEYIENSIHHDKP